MKILERYDQTKQVTAWGEVWTVPVWCEWVAIDHGGRMVGFENEPKYSLGWWGTSKGESTHPIAIVELEGGWRESLVYVGEQ
jgi:hypothetical protein